MVLYYDSRAHKKKATIIKEFENNGRKFRWIKVDQEKPHLYIDIDGYDKYWISRKGNVYSDYVHRILKGGYSYRPNEVNHLLIKLNEDVLYIPQLLYDNWLLQDYKEETYEEN